MLPINDDSPDILLRTALRASEIKFSGVAHYLQVNADNVFYPEV